MLGYCFDLDFPFGLSLELLQAQLALYLNIVPLPVHNSLRNDSRAPRLSMDKPPDPVESLGPRDVVRQERLGGLLTHYARKAA